MATNKEPAPEEDYGVPPPSYDSVVTQPAAQTKTGVPEMGFSYPPGYNTVPPQQTHFQTASPAGTIHIPPLAPTSQYYYPPQNSLQSLATVPPLPAHHPYPTSYSSTPACAPGGPVNYVIVNQPAPPLIQNYGCGEALRRGGHKPPNFMCLSLITCLCFNWMFGLLALAFSCHSDTAYASGDSQRARQYGRYAFYVNITGILLSAIFTVLLFVLF